MGPALPIIGLALGAIGTGVSVYSQAEAARTQSQFAQLNANAAQVQAAMQAQQASSQAAISAQQATNQQRAGEAQAAAFRDEAEQATRVAQINIGRQMEEQARVRSMMQAKQGASGAIVGQGSQLDILIESAELSAQQNAEAIYQANNQRRQLYRQAEGAQIGADTASLQSGIELMQGQARASAYRSQGVQAQIRGLAGVDAARGASMGALGGAVSGFGGLAFKAYDLNRLGAFG